MIPLDLFNDTYAFLYGAFRNHDTFEDIKNKNLVDFLQEDQAKRGISSNDLPELILVPNMLNGNLTANSASTSLIVTYQVLIASGSLSIVVLNECLTRVLAALCWVNHNKGTFIWEETRPLTSIKFDSAPIGMSNDEANRNIRGFSSICSFQCELRISQAMLAQTGG